MQLINEFKNKDILILNDYYEYMCLRYTNIWIHTFQNLKLQIYEIYTFKI